VEVEVNKLPLFCILFALLAINAKSQDVQYNFDNTADFSKFKTYKWITLNSEAPIDKLTDEQITAALEAGLAQKGLTKADSDHADLLIGYQTTEHINEQFGGHNSPWSVGPTWNGNADAIRTVYKGELAVAMYDPANHHLVWRGVASKSMDPKAPADKRQKNLEKAVSKLMKDYPPSK
jgi:hypothetical protein